jgi:hypothetical protein
MFLFMFDNYGDHCYNFGVLIIKLIYAALLDTWAFLTFVMLNDL